MRVKLINIRSSRRLNTYKNREKNLNMIFTPKAQKAHTQECFKTIQDVI